MVIIHISTAILNKSLGILRLKRDYRTHLLELAFILRADVEYF